ncbi:MAG: ATP synthase F1 subunit gamma [Candidatus Omnitrophota bacterium]
MSGELRALKNRIRGVENIQKITKAMEMVAAAKLKRFQKLHEQTTPYVRTLEGVLNRLLATDVPLQHPLLETREEKKMALLVITSDTGLCGSYNQNLIEEAKKFLKSRSGTPLLVGIGKHGVNALSRAGFKWFQDFADTKAFPFEFVITETDLLMEELFSERKVDAVYVVYPHSTGRSAYRVTTEKLLPFTLTPPPLFQGEGTGEEIHYILEPSREALFARLVPLVFAAKIRMILIESMIAEHTARMNAMYQASENAKELIDMLVLLRNKIRQASITKELIEIVSGSQALKAG